MKSKLNLNKVVSKPRVNEVLVVFSVILDSSVI